MKKNDKLSGLNNPFNGLPLAADVAAAANPFKGPSSSSQKLDADADADPTVPAGAAGRISRIVAATARKNKGRAGSAAKAEREDVQTSPAVGLPPQIRRILETPLHVFEALKDEVAEPGTAPLTYVGFVLDRSGSMETGKMETIEGFNTQVNAVKAEAADAGETRLGMVDFSNTPTVRYMGADVTALEPLTEKNYVPNGYTALFDGVGVMIAELLAQPGMASPETAVLVTIFTDGEENASAEYSPDVLKALITRLEATGRWTFALVGPSGSVTDLADILAVDHSNVAAYDPSSVSARVAVMASMSMASADYMMARKSGAKSRKGLYKDPGHG